MSTEFNKLMEYIESIKGQYLEAVWAFRNYQALRKLRADNVVGEEEAKRNAKTMTRFVNFFGPAEKAFLQMSLLNLAKVFDQSDQSLHINFILNYIGGNKKKISRDDFKVFNQNREFLDELYNKYEGIEISDLISVKERLKNHDLLLKKLKEYRDQYLAHNDKKKDDIKITFDEVELLFKLGEEILNLFTAKLNNSSTAYDHITNRTMADIKNILDFLDRFEPYRRKELNDRLDSFGKV